MSSIAIDADAPSRVAESTMDPIANNNTVAWPQITPNPCENSHAVELASV
jgi:hypothetical protein